MSAAISVLVLSIDPDAFLVFGLGTEITNCFTQFVSMTRMCLFWSNFHSLGRRKVWIINTIKSYSSSKSKGATPFPPAPYPEVGGFFCKSRHADKSFLYCSGVNQGRGFCTLLMVGNAGIPEITPSRSASFITLRTRMTYFLRDDADRPLSETR